MKTTMQRLKPKDTTSYIATFPPHARAVLKQMRSTIKKAAAGSREKIWYQIPTFWLNGPLVSFAGYAHHIGFYPGAAAVYAFRKEIKKYKTAKGSIQFPLDKKLPVGLITRIVKFRMKANLARTVSY